MTKNSTDIVIICGTNRKNSVSKKVSLYYQEMLEKRGVKSEIIDLAKLPHDFIESGLYENSGKNESFARKRELMLNTKKYVFIVGEYNGSFPGVLKVFIDGLQFPDTFVDKKCALVGLSAGVQGGGLALSHLTDILNYCGTHVLALKPKLARVSEFFKDGQFVNNDLYEELMQQQADQIVEF